MSLRIHTSRAERGGGVRRDGEDAVTPDNYLSRLVKLIPTEAIAFYPFLNSRAIDVAAASADAAKPTHGLSGGLQDTAPVADIVPPDAAVSQALDLTKDPLVIAVAWIMLLVVVLLRWQATRAGNSPAQWGAVFIAAVSFILWVPVMGGSFGLLDTIQSLGGWSWSEPVTKFIPELLLALWSVLVPAFYRPAG